MQDQLINLKNDAIGQILESKTLDELETVRIEYLGKSKGKLTEVMKQLPKLPVSERGAVGQTVNMVKQTIEETLTTQEKNIKQNAVANIADTEWIDVTMPSIRPPEGYIHALTQVTREVLDIFKSLGYQVVDNFDIESDYYNFTALNMPADAPSRDTQACFHLDTRGTKINPGEFVLKTQTSAMQVRVMEKTKPPMRVVVPGKCFRVDDLDASHGFEFWQLEGLYIDKNVRVTDLLGTLEYILRKLYGDKVKVRYDSTNFAFVEPGLQAYMSCTICDQKGCPFCKHTGWVEILPAGMVHPNVIKAGGLDPKEWNGFAFAVGLSRAASLKYQLDDLRLLTNPDLRILRQF